MADLVLSSVGRIDLPFIDALSFGRERRHKVDKRFLYVIFGLAMAIPSSIALALVLSSADAVFSNYLGSMLTHIILPTNWFDAIFLFAFFYVASYCGITHFLSLPNQEPVMPSIVNRKANSLLAIAFTAPITALYVGFSLVQIIFLFLGAGTLPADMTYADFLKIKRSNN